MLLVLQGLYPDVMLTNKNAKIYKQEHSLVTIRVVTGLSFVPRHENKEWLANRLHNEQDIMDNGVKFWGNATSGRSAPHSFTLKWEEGRPI